MEKRVEGIYSNVDDALQAVDRLREKGYTHENITVVANEEVRNRLSSNIDAEVTTQDTDDHHSMDRTDREDDDHSIWESIKDFFTMDDSYDETNYDNPDYDVENDPLYAHRDALLRGDIVVLISGEPNNENKMNQADLDTTSVDTNTEDKTIDLKEEHLTVDKEKEKTGEVHIGKKIVEDTETVEVPVSKEEITIERKPVGDKTTDDEINATDEDEIVIPLEEEKAIPKKETEVAEEVKIKKETKHDTQTVGDTVRHEELEVDEDEQKLDSQDGPLKDHELSREELDNYERRQ